MLEVIFLLTGSVLSVVIGIWLIGEISPKMSNRILSNYELRELAEMKHAIQRSSVRWLSVLVASVVGAYKLKDVIDLIIAAIR